MIFCLVCRPSLNKTCNVFGSTGCAKNQCLCQPGYVGDQCQFCESNKDRHCLVVNGVDEGDVNSRTGEGVLCSCNFPKRTQTLQI